ncbi:hypothetical protein [Streptomyces macrosporus]|uniref:Uncharacterized protein n=1 Tax=Streptomyces macrosporus TaxID=44032 RepID=A0ABP5WFW0_9ACTN
MTTHSRQGDEAREGVVLPSNGEPWIPGRGDSQVSPPAGQPWGQPWGPRSSPPGQPAAPAGPQAQQPPQWTPQPPAAPPQAPQVPPQPPAAGAVPGAADETQLLPPMAAAAPAGGGDVDDATRVIRPVPSAPGAPERDTESTTVLRRPLPAEGAPAPSAPRHGGAVPPPPAGAPYGIRPGTPGDRPPPADFDGLFRSSGPRPGGEPADATQQLPPIDPATAPPSPPSRQGPSYGGGGGGYEPRGRAASGGRRGLPRVAVVGIVVAGCAVAGLAAGAALSGDGDQSGKPRAAASPSAPVEESSAPSPTTDPAEAQAKELDKLLADSGDSREAVIRSVENIRKCKNLAQAAGDLRDAARQRNDLVTRLGELEIDELPDHQALADSLTKAWKASAAADNHYAAWADQVAGKKGCHKGQARTTGRTAQGNRASGEATAAKKKAAGLWNPTAREYGLPERRFDRL